MEEPKWEIGRPPEDSPSAADERQNRRGNFAKELEQLINKHCQENESDTPDFLLAGFVRDSLYAFNTATRAREAWYGRKCGDGAAILANCKPDGG